MTKEKIFMLLAPTLLLFIWFIPKEEQRPLVISPTPQEIEWIDVRNDKLGISFKAPAIWTIDESEKDGDFFVGFKKSGNEQEHLSVFYMQNILGMNRGYQGTPEEYLSQYFTDTSSNFRKTIGSINLIKSLNDPGNTRYTFFTKYKVISFVGYKVNSDEIKIIEEMISSFKLESEDSVTPKNFNDYPEEK